MTRWWFRAFFSFTPDPWGNSIQFDEQHIFQMGFVEPPTGLMWIACFGTHKTPGCFTQLMFGSPKELEIL